MSAIGPLAVRVCLLAGILVPQAAAGGESAKTGTSFRVVCDFEGPSIAAKAVKIADAAWPIAARLLGKADARPKSPAEIHLLRTEEAYAKVEEELIGGRLRKNLAFTSWRTRAAYILLQPPPSDEALKVVGLPALTKRLLAFEACHLVRAELAPNFESHPAWFVEGIAAWTADETLASLRAIPAAEKDPFRSTEIHQVKRRLERKELPSAARIFRDDYGSLDFYERYATTTLFFRFLTTGKQRAFLESVIAEIVRAGGGSGLPARVFAFVESTLRPTGLEALDREFHDYLLALRPEWEESFRSLEADGNDWIQIAFPDTNAVAWTTSSPGTTPYAIEGELDVFPGKSTQMNVLLDRNDDGFLSVAFVAGFGVTIFRYHADSERWERLAEGRAGGFRPGKRTRIRIAVEAGALHAEIDGKEVATAAVARRSMTGAWGLGAQAGSAGRWRGVRVSDSKPR